MIKAFVFDAYGTLFDVQSVADVTDAAYPGYGAYITQVWRMKQLEYSWLRSMMNQYADFWTVTEESLRYTLRTIGQTPEPALIETIAEAYNNLRPYADAEAALKALSSYRLAIFSNGNPRMLSALMAQSGLDRSLERAISVDSRRVFKPDPRCYDLVEEDMGLRRDEIVFVSSNGFDICGAKHFGFRVARIERVSEQAMTKELGPPDAAIGPATMFRALRTQLETCGPPPDHTIASLSELPALAASF